MEEIWKDVVGYEGLYKVSNLGNVKSLDRTVEQFNHAKQRMVKTTYKGRMLKQSERNNGYLFVGLKENGKKQKKENIHRLVAKAFIPNPEKKPQVNHKDRNKKNNHLSNLEWCTTHENMQHTFETGRVALIGEAVGGSKLTEEDVIWIRERFSKGDISITNLWKLFIKEFKEIDRKQVSNIVHYKSWKHI